MSQVNTEVCRTCKGKKVVVVEATRMDEHYFDIPTPCPDCTTEAEMATILDAMTYTEEGLSRAGISAAIEAWSDHRGDNMGTRMSAAITAYLAHADPISKWHREADEMNARLAQQVSRLESVMKAGWSWAQYQNALERPDEATWPES